MVLENKLGIKNSAELADAEERLSKKRAVELFDDDVLESSRAGSFDALAAIHRHLFGDIYDFAGEMRVVDIAKGGFRFAPVLYLADAVARIEAMPQSTFDEIVEKYVEMNVAHPFREGNGRAMRIWLDDMLKRGVGRAIDWPGVDKEDYLLAMERSPVRDTEIRLLLKAALTDRVSDRDIFMHGVDASYRYEGYTNYRTEEL